MNNFQNNDDYLVRLGPTYSFDHNFLSYLILSSSMFLFQKRRMEKYFTPSTPSTPSTPTASPPAAKKPKTTKRYNLSGYNDKLVEEVICSLKKGSGKGGGWRKFEKMPALRNTPIRCPKPKAPYMSNKFRTPSPLKIDKISSPS